MPSWDAQPAVEGTSYYLYGNFISMINYLPLHILRGPGSLTLQLPTEPLVSDFLGKERPLWVLYKYTSRVGFPTGKVLRRLHWAVSRQIS